MQAHKHTRKHTSIQINKLENSVYQNGIKHVKILQFLEE